MIVIGQPESIQAFSRSVTRTQKSSGARDIVVVGGGDIAPQTAKVLEERNIKPRLIEEDPTRSRTLAEALPDTLVLNHDATDIDFLQREHIDRADVLIAATDSDETNLLVALLAKTIGVPRTVAVVEHGGYKELFEAVGIDVVINPREATAEEIIRFTQEGQIENLSLIEGRQAEILEMEVNEDSVLVGRPIRKSSIDLPSEVVIGAITRGERFVIPRGETVIQSGDHVVLFVAQSVVDAVVERV